MGVKEGEVREVWGCRERSGLKRGLEYDPGAGNIQHFLKISLAAKGRTQHI